MRAFAKGDIGLQFDLRARRTGGLTSDQQPLYPEISIIVRGVRDIEGGGFHEGDCSGLLYSSGRHLVCPGQVRSTPAITAAILLVFLPANEYTPSCAVFGPDG